MARFIIGSFAGPQLVRQAEEHLLAAGFSREQIDQPLAQADSADQSVGEEVSGLQSFVASIAGEPPPAAVIPDELTAEPASSVTIRVRVTDSDQAVRAETLLRQAGAKTITRAS